LIKAGPAVRWAGSPLGRQSGWNLLPDLVLLNIPNPKLHIAGRTLQAAPCRPHLGNNLIFYLSVFTLKALLNFGC